MLCQTPWPRASSPRSNASSSTGARFNLRPRRVWQSSSSSKPGTTENAVTPVSATDHQPTLRGATCKPFEIQAMNRPRNRGMYGPPRVCTAELNDGGVDRLLRCIRPVEGSAFALPGPDGIRTHRPHQLRGLGDPCPVQGSSVSVRPVLPSLVLCPRNRRRPRRRERVRANYAAFAP